MSATWRQTCNLTQGVKHKVKRHSASPWHIAWLEGYGKLRDSSSGLAMVVSTLPQVAWEVLSEHLVLASPPPPNLGCMSFAEQI